MCKYEPRYWFINSICSRIVLSNKIWELFHFSPSRKWLQSYFSTKFENHIHHCWYHFVVLDWIWSAGTWATILLMYQMFLVGFRHCRIWRHCMFHSSSIYLCVCECVSVCTSSWSVCDCILNIIKLKRKVYCSKLMCLSFLNGRMMENTRLQGEVPQALFSNYNLETLWVSYWLISWI